MAGLQKGLQESLFFSCQRCLKYSLSGLTPRLPYLETKRNSKGSNYGQRLRRREEKKAIENQYVGENAIKTKTIYAWGLAASGALGIAHFLRPELGTRRSDKVIEKINRPARVQFFDEARLKPLSIACGHGFSVIYVKREDKKLLIGTGVNTDSQIGYHESPKGSGRVLDVLIEPGRIRIPAKRPDNLNILSMSCGRAHTVVVVEGEGVFSLGNNASGQCGRPVVHGEEYRKNQSVNKLRGLPNDIEKVVCGQDHTLFLTASGAVWSCGLGADGQTGVGHYDITDRPQVVKGDIEGERIVSVAAKGDLSLAVSDKGDLFGWGNSEYGQLGSITDETQVNIPRRLPTQRCGKVIKAVAGGAMCALLNDKGQVFVWGYGLLGKGPTLEVTSEPSMIPSPLFGQTELSPDARVVDIECGLTYLVARTNEGNLFSWGRNNQGCLGLGISKNQLFPWKVSLPAEPVQVSCGPDHMLALCKAYT